MREGGAGLRGEPQGEAYLGEWVGLKERPAGRCGPQSEACRGGAGLRERPGWRDGRGHTVRPSWVSGWGIRVRLYSG
ncbi:hypothetical protein KY289_015376 [Solanum tuberosum]|nr:hypothetical protein KY289_015376 [Solanum tuberosum]